MFEMGLFFSEFLFVLSSAQKMSHVFALLSEFPLVHCKSSEIRIFMLNINA